MTVDVNTINRLISTLNQSKLQATNPALYQCIQQLINATQQQVSALKDDTSNLSSSISNGSIGGINQLTGDATAGPGSGSQAITVGSVTAWTPALKFGGASSGLTYTTQTGHYFTVGKLLVLFGHLVLSAVGSSTGNATIEGLPVAVATEIGNFNFTFVNNFSALVPIFGTAAVGTTIITINITPSAPNVDETAFMNNTELIFYGAYLKA